MAGERPQFINHDLLQSEQAAAPADPEPLDGQPHSGLGWGDLPPQPTWQEYQRWGEQRYDEAQKMEAAYGLIPDTVDAYHQARVDLINVTSTAPLETWWGEAPADPVRMLKIATCLAKEADAPEVAAYGESPLFDPHPESPKDRRTYLRKLSADAMHRVSEMIYGIDENNEMRKEFDEAQQKADEQEAEHLQQLEARQEVIAAAAVEAARDVSTEFTLGPGAVDAQAAERLQTEGRPAIRKFIETHAAQAEGAQFVARMGEIAIEKLATEEYQLPLAA